MCMARTQLAPPAEYGWGGHVARCNTPHALTLLKAHTAHLAVHFKADQCGVERPQLLPVRRLPAARIEPERGACTVHAHAHVHVDERGTSTGQAGHALHCS